MRKVDELIAQFDTREKESQEQQTQLKMAKEQL